MKIEYHLKINKIFVQSVQKNHMNYRLFHLILRQEKALQVQIISMKSFKEQYGLPKRKEIYQKSIKLHPNKIAVVVQAHPRSKLPINRYFKFMAGDNYTASSIQQIIKRDLMRTSKWQKNEITAIYLFCKNKLLKASDLLKDLLEHRDPQDNFLYLTIAETEAF